MQPEKCHMSFCKYILGVSSKATNAAVRGELGSYPVGISMYIHCIKYYYRFNNVRSDNILLHNAYQETMQLNLPWYVAMGKMLNVVNCNNMTSKMPSVNQLGVVLKSLYNKQWYEVLNRNPNERNKQGNKLRIYNKFKYVFECEKYLHYVKDRAVRAYMCKLRISVHDLMVEKGRYLTPKLEYDKRFCRRCPTIVENEFHFLFDCKRYCNAQAVLFKEITEIYPQFQCLDLIDQFTHGMQCNECDLTMSVCKYVSQAFNVRYQQML